MLLFCVILLPLRKSHTIFCHTNCIRCTIALNKRMKNYTSIHRKKATVEQIGNFALTYLGKCYCNRNLALASAEEPQSAMKARELLVNGKSKYVGYDGAIFVKVITSDNDTQAPFSFICKQNEIIGTSANDHAEHLSDKDHVTKCKKIRTFQDPSG